MAKLRKKQIFTVLVTAGLSLSLTHCGFGGNGSDPLEGKDSSSYVTESERQQNEQDWQARFEQETQAYEQSITALEQENQTRIQNLTSEYEAIEQRLRSQNTNNQEQWQTQRAQFEQELASFRAEQEQVIAGLRSTVDTWEQRTLRCEDELQNPEPLNFQGLLYQFELAGALAETFEWNVQEPQSHQILFELNVGGDSVQGLDITPELPEGLSLQRGEQANTWVISGAPQVEVPLGQTSVSSTFTIRPVIDTSLIENERERALVQQQTVEKDVVIKINQIRQRPELEVSQDGDRLLIHVMDPADIQGDQAPTVSFSLQNDSGTSANQTMNAASLITAAISGENPRKVGEGWTYVYQIHPSLAPENWRNLTAQITVNSQSVVSGLTSVPVTRGLSIEESL